MGLLLANAARDTEVRGAEYAVLQQLALRAHDAKGRCWPSVETLARDARLVVRSVYRALRRLVDLGLITVTRGGGRGRTNEYLLHLKVAAAACGKAAAAAAETLTQGRKNPDTESDRKRSEKKKEKVAPRQPVDKSRPWASGFSHLSGFFGTSSFASSGRGTPSRPGGSPMPGSPPCTPPARSTTASASSCSGTPPEQQSVAELVAEFLAERRAVPR